MKNFKKTLAILMFVSLLFLPLASFALDVGDQAPGFTANSTLGEVSLADYAGKKNVVLPLYFAVFTSV
jgi:peroxiredoxin